MYAVKKHIVIVKEGSSENFLNGGLLTVVEPIAAVANAEEPGWKRGTVAKLSGLLAEDILNMCLAGATINNDNEPAPENILGPAAEGDATDVFR